MSEPAVTPGGMNPAFTLNLSDRFTSLSQIFAQEDFDLGELRAMLRIEGILNPAGTYNGLTAFAALEKIRAERADLCFRMIDAQSALAKAGAERVRTICDNFNHYATLIGGQTGAVETDLYQQDIDVAIMATLSHSQMLFAKTYAVDQPDQLAAYQAKVDAQFSALETFRAEGLTEIASVAAMKNRYREYGDSGEDNTGMEQGLGALSLSTLDVALCNDDLGALVEDLVRTQLRGFYYWREYLKEGSHDPQTVADHTSEMEYERDLNTLYIQRRAILATRGAQLGQLSEMILKI